MTTTTDSPQPDALLSKLRLVAWSLVAFLIALPAIAMAAGAEGVDWGPEDFVAATILLGGSGLLIEALVRVSDDWSYRIGAGLGVMATLMTIWANLAVGIVGSEDNAFNLGYFALVPILAVGALFARLRADRMATLMRFASIWFAAMLVAMFVAGHGRIEPAGAVGLTAIHAVFFALYWIAGMFFDRAARRVR